VIIVIIALSVACGYEYDFEYDWSRSSSPPKKEEVIPKAQVVDPKTQVVTGNPKLPDGSYKYWFSYHWWDPRAQIGWERANIPVFEKDRSWWSPEPEGGEEYFGLFFLRCWTWRKVIVPIFTLELLLMWIPLLNLRWVKTTELPALDVEEEHVNMTMPSTAVSVPDSVKELTEADLKTANVTGEIWSILPGVNDPK
jgi:hypothetical protein